MEMLSDVEMRVRIAEGPLTPTDWLTRLAADEESDVYRAALANPSLPHESMTSFLERALRGPIHPLPQNGESIFIADLKAFIRNPSLTAAMLAQLAESTFFNQSARDDLGNMPIDCREALMLILKNGACPQDLLHWAIESGTDEMGQSAASNPTLTTSQVRDLLFAPRDSRTPLVSQGLTMLSLTSNPAVSLDLLFSLLLELNWVAVMNLGQKLHGDPRQAACLAVIRKSNHPVARQWAAEHETDPLHLHSAATDDEFKVRRAVALNSAVSSTTIRILCHDPEGEVRQLAADNPAATEEDRVIVALLR